MPNKTVSSISGRRQFLTNILPTGALFCLGCSHLLALPETPDGRQTLGKKSKFLENSGMSVKDVWTFTYEMIVPTFQNMAKDIGREKLIEMVKKASSESWFQRGSVLSKSIPKKDMNAFAAWFTMVMSAPPFGKAFTFKATEKSEKAFEATFTECLPAVIYRQMNASDIGYAFDCYPMTAMAKGFDSRMKLANPKNMVKGDDTCILRFSLEG